MTNEEAVFSIFLMRFNLQPSAAMIIIQKWLAEHPDENWKSLKYFLQEDKLTVFQGKIKEVMMNNQTTSPHRSATIQNKVENLKFNQNAQRKRRYRGQEY